MEKAQETQALDDLRLELAMLSNEALWCSILGKIHLAPNEIMKDIPLYLLEMLLYLARVKKMDKAVEALKIAIELNLEAQRRAREAKRRADEAERRADEAERRADEAEQWLEEIKDLQKSIKARLAAEGVETDEFNEIDEFDE